MAAVLIYAGLRREEFLHWLMPDDINLNRRASGGNSGGGGHGMIRICAKTIQMPTGPRAWQPKTRTNLAVPVSCRTLRQYIDRDTPPATTRSTTSADVPGWYFPSPPQPSRSLWDPDNFSRERRATNTAGARFKWASLDDRHTFGSQLAQNGVSLYKIATMMGNSPEICRKHYAALVPEAMAGEVEFNLPSSIRDLTEHNKTNTFVIA